MWNIVLPSAYKNVCCPNKIGVIFYDPYLLVFCQMGIFHPCYPRERVSFISSNGRERKKRERERREGMSFNQPTLRFVAQSAFIFFSLGGSKLADAMKLAVTWTLLSLSLSLSLSFSLSLFLSLSLSLSLSLFLSRILC